MSDTAELNQTGSGSATPANTDGIFDPVIEAAPVALILVNSAGTICLVNRQTELLFGYSRDDLIAQPIEKLLPQEFRQGHPGNRRGYMESPEPRAMGSGRDLFGQTRSGQKIAIEIGLNPIHTQDGAYVLASVIDISERKAQENAIRASEARLSAIFNSSSDAIIGMSLGAVVTEWNPAAEDMFGYARAEAVGRNIVDLIVPERQADEEAEIFRRIRAGEQVGRFESSRQRKDGSTIEISATISPIRYADGTLQGATKVIRDITEQKEAEKVRNELNESLSEQVRETRRALNHLQETQSQLVQAEKMASLGGLVAGVAHEINTPVGIGVTAASHLRDEVTKVADSVQQGKLTKKQFADFVEMTVVTSQMILTNLGRAADLIQSFKRVAVDRSSDEIRVIDVSEYLDEILMSLKPRFRHTPHEIQLDSEPDIQIETAPGAWSQVITNLVLNAQIHGLSETEPGKILVTAKRDDQQLRVEVKDNGKGVSSENLEKIFDPFFTTRRAEGGSGLGLNIVYNLVTQTIGGKISVASVPGQWTRFTILLPLTEQQRIAREQHDD